MFGGSTSPFIEEGDGFTSERERVRTFLSLVAHATGMGQWWAPAILLMLSQNVRYMWEVELLSSRLEDVGTCKNAVFTDWEHGFTTFTWYGEFWRPQYC